MTQEPIIHVDCTPDDEYPLRILRAYRERCNVRWEATGSVSSEVCDLINEHCEQRAIILDKAIAILEAQADSTDDVLKDIMVPLHEVRGDEPVQVGKFRQNLLYAFKHEPIEDGCFHSGERIICDTINRNGLLTFSWLDSIYSDYINSSTICSGILRCLGRQPVLVGINGTDLARRGLAHADSEVREAAVRALECWGGPDSISVLKAHNESVGWLNDYIKQVIEDLSEDRI